jgi:hypothetical protein
MTFWEFCDKHPAIMVFGTIVCLLGLLVLDNTITNVVKTWLARRKP